MLSALASRINAEHKAAERSASEALEHARRCGELLIEAKGKVGHGGFEKWILKNCQFSKGHAWRYMKLTAGWDKLEPNLARAQHLSLREAIRLLSDDGDEPAEPDPFSDTPIAPVPGLDDEQSAINHDRYTPPNIIEDVRHVFDIDLDPASSKEANRVVQAKKIFTKDNDGLSKQWRGNVFLNPPFDDWSTWMAKLDEEIEAGRVKQAIIIGPANLSAFRPLLHRGGVLLLPDERPKYRDPHSDRLIGPPYGSLIGYIGSHRDRFSSAFDERGLLLASL